ncbi:TPA_asm: MC060R [Molluscum contagiosum virus]|uniref:MC060R n=1 Tax=Molluscum contagiosum virus TaxID=10279 RepID=A0A858A3B1_9POXV|nr:MC060 [Molluscum contagiosum virus subtype 1]QHW17866.1 MC060R [Molluscum contagiosum virus]AYO88379.1 MC060 [Molluscum contagiosum virus subtype 1]AYO88555.1 MC060 [Molluscum contagiosum virus subtype 1]AYO88909.1 MC060 [Molluscum contagiosum virus subtype 1]
MGIKNLKALLLQHESLLARELPGEHAAVFVDFMGVYIAAAYSAGSARELRSTMNAKLQAWRARAPRVVLFVDRGVIDIKRALRQRRQDSIAAACARKREAVRALAARASALDPADPFYAETREGLRARIRKARFYLFLAEAGNLYRLRDELLAAAPPGVAVVHCDEVDAEFEMCARALALARSTGRWPLLVSNDQDTLCLACADALPKAIASAGAEYELWPSTHAVYLAKLTVLLNGCDFFPGLAGLAVTRDTLPRFRLFEDFSMRNVLRSLAFRDYALRGAARVEDARAILRFIERYVALERAVYREPPPPPMSVHAFLRAALAPLWAPLAAARAAGTALLDALAAALQALPAARPRRSRTRRAARGMLAYHRERSPTREDVALLAGMLGFRVGPAPGLLAVCLQRRDVLLCFEGAFYFSDRFIIEKRAPVINICA